MSSRGSRSYAVVMRSADGVQRVVVSDAESPEEAARSAIRSGWSVGTLRQGVDAEVFALGDPLLSMHGQYANPEAPSLREPGDRLGDLVIQ